MYMQASRTHLTPGHFLHLCRTQKIALHSPKTEEIYTFPLLWNRQAITAPQILLITQFTGVLLSHRHLCSHSAQENGGKQSFLSTAVVCWSCSLLTLYMCNLWFFSLMSLAPQNRRWFVSNFLIGQQQSKSKQCLGLP